MPSAKRLMASEKRRKPSSTLNGLGRVARTLREYPEALPHRDDLISGPVRGRFRVAMTCTPVADSTNKHYWRGSVGYYEFLSMRRWATSVSAWGRRSASQVLRLGKV
jgi:hypothetical protein